MTDSISVNLREPAVRRVHRARSAAVAAAVAVAFAAR